MPHIDEGTLHALLDGALRAMEPDRADAVEAHLETCAECRALAEEAAELRGRAAGILGVLEPAVKPDFEEVLVRAGAGAAPVSGRDPRLAARLRWTRRFAWAATLVVAVGMGYLLRDQFGPELGLGDGAEPQSAVDRAERAVEEQEMEAVDAGAGAVGTAGPREDAAPSVARPATPVLEQTGPPTAADESRLERALDGGTEARRQANSRGEAVEEGDVAMDVRLYAADTTLPEPRADVDALRLDRALPLTDALASKAVVGSGEQVQVRLRGVSGNYAAPATVYESVAPEDVPAAVGAPLMVLPGAEVVWAQVGRRGETERVVLSLQRLGDGVGIRVLQQPTEVALEGIVVTAAGDRGEGRAVEREAARPAAPPAAAAAAPPPAPAPPLGRAFTDHDLPAGHFRVTGPANWLGWELVLEGPLPEEALRALARQVAPYGGWAGR